MAQENLTDLASLVNKETRQAWLEAHQPQINLNLIEALKEEVDRLKLSDPQRAKATAEAALEAASFLFAPTASALAKWALGNALMSTGDFALCLPNRAG